MVLPRVEFIVVNTFVEPIEGGRGPLRRVASEPGFAEYQDSLLEMWRYPYLGDNSLTLALHVALTIQEK